MIPKPQPPTTLPTLAECDEYLEHLKEEMKTWKEFRKIIASRCPADATCPSPACPSGCGEKE